jgi:CRP-like cAMP-binding protein
LASLAAIPLFSTCTPKELARIDRLGTPFDVKLGRTLIREGELGRECFVALSGVAVVDRAGRRIGAIGTGSVAGEMALLDGARRNATVVAGTSMELLVFTDLELREMLAIVPRIGDDLRRIVAQRRIPSQECAGSMTVAMPVASSLCSSSTWATSTRSSSACRVVV